MIRACQELEPVCERCGRCLSVCPVYRELRIETVSPRGRLDLIRAVTHQEIQPKSGTGLPFTPACNVWDVRMRVPKEWMRPH